jgi:predicted ATPase
MARRSKRGATSRSGPFIETVAIEWEGVSNRRAYPYDIPALAQLTEPLPLHPQVTFFVGENGSGKSTLLEAIAVAMGFNPEGGSKNMRFSTRESHSDLSRALELLPDPWTRPPRDGFFLRAESFFNVATAIESLDQENPDMGRQVIRAYGGVSLHERSHGEAFLALVEHRFRGESLFLLDEPEAALSPARQLVLLGHMRTLITQGAQFIIATHSPILMGYPGASILSFTSDGIAPIAFEDTEHFRITRDFLVRRESMLRELFREDDTPDDDGSP